MDFRIFDDDGKINLAPLVLLRGTADLRCGILTLKEKIEIDLGHIKSPYIVMINARTIIDERLISILSKTKEEKILTCGKDLVAAVLKKETLKEVAANTVFSPSTFDGFEIRTEEITAKLIKYPWDLIYLNGEEISQDIKRLKLKASAKNINRVDIVNRKSVFIGRNCNIKPGVVLDAEDGPIVIDDGATILANSVIMGPAYIGKNSTIKAIAKIYGQTSIGPMCKVGGEVEGSIIHGYSNKQHDGFLGHSYICEWVNLGADTNNSDLKNNYGNVKVNIDGKTVDSGHMFVGLIMGDHSKSAINTMFNTGTVVGVSSNIFGAGFPPKFVPSFAWGGSEKLTEYDLNKAVEVAKTVMKRRKVVMSKEYEKNFRKSFEETKEQRRAYLSSH